MEYSETYDFSSGKKPCMAWFAKGECPKEDGCLLDHHDNLHPTKHQKAHADLVVENETGRSCDRCLLKMLKVSQSLYLTPAVTLTPHSVTRSAVLQAATIPALNAVGSPVTLARSRVSSRKPTRSTTRSAE